MGHSIEGMKQETLEEVSEKFGENIKISFPDIESERAYCFKLGAKWQAGQEKQEIKDLKSRLDIIRESSTKTIELVKKMQRQQERSYSEEEVLDLVYKRDLYMLNRDEKADLELPEQWFEQFKKK